MNHDNLSIKCLKKQEMNAGMNSAEIGSANEFCFRLRAQAAFIWFLDIVHMKKMLIELAIRWILRNQETVHIARMDSRNASIPLHEQFIPFVESISFGL